MSRKWLDYLGGHSIIHTGQSGLSVDAAALYQMEVRFAQQESDAQHEADRRRFLEKLNEVEQKIRDRRDMARAESLVALARARGLSADSIAMVLDMFKDNPRALAMYHRALTARPNRQWRRAMRYLDGIAARLAQEGGG
jgi:hypothetical protein